MTRPRLEAAVEEARVVEAVEIVEAVRVVEEVAEEAGVVCWVCAWAVEEQVCYS